MESVYTFGAGLPLFIMGIAFLRNRINFIKKGHRAIATLVKLEEQVDSDGDISYIPYFKFATCDNRDFTYLHTPTQWKDDWNWKPGKKVKVAYKEGYLYNQKILLLTFWNAFGLATFFLTAGIALLVAAGGIYNNASFQTFCILIPVAICLPATTVTILGNRFLKTLHC